jgi:Exopolysaccharide synthesis, ExoD
LEHKHTSELLEELVSQAPDGPVDLEWLLKHLDRRSFGLLLLLLLLLLGLLVLIPGVATLATVMLFFPSVEMMLGHSSPTFPQFLSKRCFDFGRFKRFTDKMQPALRGAQPAQMGASARAGGSPCRSRRLRVGIVGDVAAAAGECNPRDGDRPHRGCLSPGGRISAGDRRDSRVPDAARIRMDGVDVGSCGDAVDIVDIRRTVAVRSDHPRN